MIFTLHKDKVIGMRLEKDIKKGISVLEWNYF